MSELRLLYRKARSEDVYDIKAIENACGLSPWSIKDYLEETEKNQNCFLVCEYERKPIGFILARLIMNSDYLFQIPKIQNHKNDGLNQHQEKEKAADSDELPAEVEILNLGVLKEFRRNGIGTEFLQIVLNDLKKYNKYSIILDVRISNIPAIEFYKELNFRIITRRKNLYANPLEDGYFMKLEKN